ncbi:hypothetical protein [uncultured Cetobacterium sp.]|uniref:hypothetical protein n=1 Tax=uncultured Cetobacterium sp. TaxID=527638 RepID=UPI00260B0E0E|nr:hypothetical protein [uncultured Cetobacterium sp.]
MKKTLFITLDSQECIDAQKVFTERMDIKIVDIKKEKESSEKYQIKKTPTLVVEEWEKVVYYVGLQEIKDYSLDEPTPNYPCVCSM